MKLSSVRVGFQILLHALLAGHVLAYYFLDWKRIGALDFQTFFHYFLGDGLLTAGAILTIAVYGSALVFGRLFCSWGCHFGAAQDLAAWILRRMRWKPPLLRVRFLNLLPYAVLAAVFLVPCVERWGKGEWGPLRKDTAAVPPWDTLPGWWGSIATFLGCGALILLFLGTRGFCRFVCPYGALFRITDRATPFRVRRTAPCSSSCAAGGVHPCTAACPTAIDVHFETSELGAVRSVDCVRCNLCIEACPSQALSHVTRATAQERLAAAVPAAAPTGGTFRPLGVPARAAPFPEARKYDLPLWGEILVLSIAVASYFTFDLVYGGHFLAAALAMGEGFLAFQAVRALLRDGTASIFGRPLRVGKNWTFAGITVVGALALSCVPLFEAAAFKWLLHEGQKADPEAASEEAGEIQAGAGLIAPAVRSRLELAADRYRRALEYFPSDGTARRLLISAYVRLGDSRAVEEAELLLQREANEASRKLHEWVSRRFKN